MRIIGIAAALLLVSASAWGQVIGGGGGTSVNPVSTLQRPNNTTGYSSGQLIASSTAAGSIAVPTIALGGAPVLPRIRLSTNATTGWGSGTLQVTLWNCAPTYNNGDGGTYSVATGAGCLVAAFLVTLSQYGDGASGAAAPTVGSAVVIPPGIYRWDLQSTYGSTLTPIANQVFTLTLEAAQ